MEQESYKAGDKVAVFDNYNPSPIRILDVVRLTATQAILNDGTRLKINDVQSCRAIGSSIYTTTRYNRADSKDIQKFKTSLVIKRIKSQLEKIKSGIDTIDFDYNDLLILESKIKEIL